MWLVEIRSVSERNPKKIQFAHKNDSTHVVARWKFTHWKRLRPLFIFETTGLVIALTLFEFRVALGECILGGDLQFSVPTHSSASVIALKGIFENRRQAT